MHAAVDEEAKRLDRQLKAQQSRTIKLRCQHRVVPDIQSDDFLRTRMKSGSRFFLVSEVAIRHGRLHSYIDCVCYPCTREDWMNREPGQATHWYHHNYRR